MERQGAVLTAAGPSKINMIPPSNPSIAQRLATGLTQQGAVPSAPGRPSPGGPGGQTLEIGRRTLRGWGQRPFRFNARSAVGGPGQAKQDSRRPTVTPAKVTGPPLPVDKNDPCRYKELRVSPPPSAGRPLLIANALRAGGGDNGVRPRDQGVG